MANRSARYPVRERDWVERLLARLTDEQRARYAEACKTARRHPNGKLYDKDRARVAERILYEDTMKARA